MSRIHTPQFALEPSLPHLEAGLHVCTSQCCNDKPVANMCMETETFKTQNLYRLMYTLEHASITPSWQVVHLLLRHVPVVMSIALT